MIYYDSLRYKIDVDTSSRHSGGEGNIFNVVKYDNPLFKNKRLALKLFKNQANIDLKRKKIQDMITLNKNNQVLYDKIRLLVSFPITQVYEDIKGERYVGYLMPSFSNCITLDKFSSIDLSRRENIIWNVNNALKAATTLCYITEILHKMGYIIGDFNDNNILVDDKNISHLIDTDSMSFNEYKCNVGVQGFISKEINDSRGEKKYTFDSDNYALSVHIYKLLTGAFPYNYQGDVNNNRGYNIKNDCYPILFPNKYEVPLYSASLKAIPKKLKILFIDSFLNERNRPDASLWRTHLLDYKKKIKMCSEDGSHEYFICAKKCPYCEILEKINNEGSTLNKKNKPRK